MSALGAPTFRAPRAIGVRARLFLVSVALILSMGATSAVYLEFELRRELEDGAVLRDQRLLRARDGGDAGGAVQGRLLAPRDALRDSCLSTPGLNRRQNPSALRLASVLPAASARGISTHACGGHGPSSNRQDLASP